ncbi:hypothetical protein RB25_11720 [Herbaspirillum rubrisubalbicans]|nr:hypothetical protein RB25_11720 [Herbaspirillum rubrisubalbicans]
MTQLIKELAQDSADISDLHQGLFKTQQSLSIFVKSIDPQKQAAMNHPRYLDHRKLVRGIQLQRSRLRVSRHGMEATPYQPTYQNHIKNGECLT